MLSKCKFGGGHSCKRQGGDGSSFHKSIYVHPFTSTVEIDKVADGFIVKSSDVVVPLTILEDNFDDDFAKSILSSEIFEAVMATDIVRKAMYDIDVDSVDGITRILSLLPILDPEIMKLIYQECFPGYDPSALSPRMMRIELRGYLTDMLEQANEYGETENTETVPGDDSAESETAAGDIDNAEVTATGDSQPAGEEPDTTGPSI